MSDVTQGQDVPDQDLFRDATETTLEKFENPPLREPPKEIEKPPPEPKLDTEAAVPSGRLREENEARRRAEREAADLRAQLAAYQVQRPQQQPQQKLDVFDNPSAFVHQEMRPYLEQFKQEMQMTREAMSADSAVRLYGEERVSAARAALEQGMARQDPQAWATYNRAMSSHDPYGVITRAHLDRETLQQIGGDLDSYKARVLEEAMKDPAFQRQVMEAARGQAASAGRQVNQVTQPKVSFSPSLSDIGTAGLDEQLQESSDENALFRAAVSAKRRR